MVSVRAVDDDQGPGLDISHCGAGTLPPGRGYRHRLCPLHPLQEEQEEGEEVRPGFRFDLITLVSIQPPWGGALSQLFFKR